jgi:acyl carrier protein
VLDAIVMAREDSQSDKRLVAYLVAVEGADLNTGELRAYLQGKLPDYMIPSAFVLLPEFPRTSSGKIDRRALPAPDSIASRSQDRVTAPRTEVERIIISIWQEVLGVEQIGIHDNFFDLGGHSLLLVDVHSKLRESLGQDIPITDMFEYPTVTRLAERFAKSDSDSATTERQRIEQPQAETNGAKHAKDRLRRQLKQSKRAASEWEEAGEQNRIEPIS